MFEDQNTPSNLPVGGASGPAPAPAPKPPASPPLPTRTLPAPGEPSRISPPESFTGGEPEDIFSKVEPAQKGTTAPSSFVPSEEAAVKEPLVSSRKVIMVVGIVLGVAVLSGAAWGIMRFAKRAASPAPAQPTLGVPVTPEAAALPEIPSLPAPLPPEDPATLPGAQLPSETPAAVPQPAQAVDTDGDGLTDEEEAAAGTQPTNTDSDNDTLFDGEEVNTYGTDPLDPDTDGDGFLDGQEVRNGYNPKGEGRLFSVPSQ